MKRLIRKASQVFYHGTSKEYLERITSSGAMIPNASRGAGKNNNNDGSAFYGFNFFATTAEKAMEFATYIPPSQTEAYVILEVNLSEDTLLPDDDDMTGATVWQDSANSIGQVKVEGEVPASSIVAVHLYNNESRELVVSTTMDNWQKDFEANITSFLDEWQLEQRNEEY